MLQSRLRRPALHAISKRHHLKMHFPTITIASIAMLHRHQPFARPFGLLRDVAAYSLRPRDLSQSSASYLSVDLGIMLHSGFFIMLERGTRLLCCDVEHLANVFDYDEHTFMPVSARPSLLDTPTEIKAITLVSLRKAKARTRPARILHNMRSAHK